MTDYSDQCDRLPSKLPNLPQPAKTTLMDEQFLSKNMFFLIYSPCVSKNKQEAQG